MMVIANVFRKLHTVKNLVTPLCKKSRFGTPWEREHVKVSPIIAKSTWERFYHVFSLIWGKLIWKMSPPVLGQISGVFVKTLTVDGKYPVQYCEILQLPILMQVSEKRKTFSKFFAPFMDSISNFKHFEKKDDGHS